MIVSYLLSEFIACNSDWYLVYNDNAYLIKNIMDKDLLDLVVDYVEIDYSKREVLIW